LRQGEESGQAYISIGDDGENEIHTYFGANLKLDGSCLNDPERLKLIAEAKVCVIMDPPLETARCLAELCKEHYVSVIWDPGVYAQLGLEALMPTLIDLRRRVKSVKNTEQITKAMKTVSSAKLKKAQRVVLEGRPHWHNSPDLLARLEAHFGKDYGIDAWWIASFYNLHGQSLLS
jgi:sugar/nucleoside kinase (ribokinase family)